MKTPYSELTALRAQCVSLCELRDAYLKDHPHYLGKSEGYAVLQSFRILLSLFSDDEIPDVSDFKVGYLVKYLKTLAELNLAKTQVVRLFNVVKKVFKWGAKPRFDDMTYDELPGIISVDFVAKMEALNPYTDEKLSKIIEPCRSNPPRQDAPLETIKEASEKLPPMIADMLKLQLLTSMRPSEVCKMRGSDLKRTRGEFRDHSRLFDGENWIYVLSDHKTAKRSGTKIIPLGIEEQEVISKYLDTEKPETAVFKNRAGRQISRAEYGRVIKKTIERFGLPKFTAYQVRHTAVTKTSEEHGRDIARAVAGHTTEVMTARYDHSDYEKRLFVVRERNTVYRERKVVGLSYADKSTVLHIFRGE